VGIIIAKIIDGERQCMGVGVLIRDYHGFVNAAISKKKNGVQDPTVAEAGGALLAAEFCRDLGFLDVILEGDCLTVIKALRDSNLSWSAYGQIIGDVAEMYVLDFFFFLDE
jgi:hypothetical protein